MFKRVIKTKISHDYFSHNVQACVVPPSPALSLSCVAAHVSYCLLMFWTC